MNVPVECMAHKGEEAAIICIKDDGAEIFGIIFYLTLIIVIVIFN